MVKSFLDLSLVWKRLTTNALANKPNITTIKILSTSQGGIATNNFTSAASKLTSTATTLV
jgi:hypothetical protein